MVDTVTRNANEIPGPVVVGGVGGSGTRVIAEILERLNFYMGNDISVVLDNFAYTLLFKRPRWFYRHRNDRQTLFRGLGIMEKAMLRPGGFSLAEYLYLFNACLTMSIHGHNKEKVGSGIWPFERVKKLFGPVKGGIVSYTGWGWKEPNSHLLIREMNDFYPGFKYVHLIRHGLDMAFSPNQQQLFNWGPMFGIDPPSRDEDIPAASFRYWVEANRSALKTGETLGPGRFLWINYDQFCSDPEPGLKRVLSFLGLDVEETLFQRCMEVPKVAESTGRFRNHSLEGFDPENLAFLESLGFNTDMKE